MSLGCPCFYPCRWSLPRDPQVQRKHIARREPETSLLLQLESPTARQQSRNLSVAGAVVPSTPTSTLDDRHSTRSQTTRTRNVTAKQVGERNTAPPQRIKHRCLMDTKVLYDETLKRCRLFKSPPIGVNQIRAKLLPTQDIINLFLSKIADSKRPRISLSAAFCVRSINTRLIPYYLSIVPALLFFTLSLSSIRATPPSTGHRSQAAWGARQHRS